MSKSKRVNLSVPSVLYERYAEFGRLTGLSVPGVMVQALAVQASYMQRQIYIFKNPPRELPREIVVSDAQGGFASPSSGSGKGSGAPGGVKVSRKQRLRESSKKGA